MSPETIAKFLEMEITNERAHRIGKKEEGKRRTIIAKFLNYKQREKVLNKYKELKFSYKIYNQI